MAHHHGTDPPLPIDADLDLEAGADRVGDQPTRSPTHLDRDPLVVASVGAGGFLGTTARYLVVRGWPTDGGAFPLATLLINTSGAFLLGLVLVTLIERFPGARRARPFLCTGALGGWTTMSTLAVEAVLLADGGSRMTAIGYLAATLIAGVVAGSLGIWVAYRVPWRRSWA